MLGGLRPLDLGLVLDDRRPGLLDLRSTPAHLRLGLAQLRLRQPELRLGLIDGGLKRTRIDLEQEVAGLDERALLVVLAHEVAADPGADLGVDVPDQRAYVFHGDRHVPLHDRLDFDRGERGRRGGPGRVAAATGDRRQPGDQQALQQHARGEEERGHRLDRLAAVLHVRLPRRTCLRTTIRGRRRPSASQVITRHGMHILENHLIEIRHAQRTPGDPILRLARGQWSSQVRRIRYQPLDAITQPRDSGPRLFAIVAESLLFASNRATLEPRAPAPIMPMLMRHVRESVWRLGPQSYGSARSSAP